MGFFTMLAVITFIHMQDAGVNGGPETALSSDIAEHGNGRPWPRRGTAHLNNTQDAVILPSQSTVTRTATLDTTITSTSTSITTSSPYL
jgi:hypothetical protein